MANPVTLFLCGDVMTGRGIDQILSHPSPPAIYEPFVRDARGYVEIAELATGPIPRPVDPAYIWGDALAELDRHRPDWRIINLETSVTRSNDYWPGKGINYRMNPGNISCLTVAVIDCCTLANNHVLDWGYAGLAETLHVLRETGISSAGAGANIREAEAPAVLEGSKKPRVLIFAFGSLTSGILPNWAATETRPGVNLVSLSPETVDRVRSLVEPMKRPGDVVVASIHWGGNWGYRVPAEQQRFAHQLIDQAGVDLIHGHSSHHVKAIELYRGKAILYGCGDLLNDYEGIPADPSYRSDLGLLYFIQVDPSTGQVLHFKMTPTQVRHFRLNRASPADRLWLQETLNREGQPFGTRVELDQEGGLVLHEST